MRKSLAFFLVMLCLLHCPSAVRAQSNVDSLVGVWENKSLSDTARLRAIGRLVKVKYLRNKPDSAIHFTDMGLKLSTAKGHHLQTARLLHIKGEALTNLNRNPEAIVHLDSSFAIYERLGPSIDMAGVLMALGNVYQTQGDHTKAVSYMTRSMKLNAKLGNTQGEASGLINIGNMYFTQGDDTAAFEHYSKGLEIIRKMDNKLYMGICLMNIGNIYHNWKQYEKAIETYTEGKALAMETNDKGVEAGCMANIGLVKFDQGLLDEALQYLQSSIPIYEAIGNKKGHASSLSSISKIYMQKGDLKKAVQCGERALELAHEGGSVNRLKSISYALYEVYAAAGNSKGALDAYKVYITMRDSLMSQDNQRGLIRQQMQYDHDNKTALARAEQDKKDAIAAEQLHRRNQQRNALIVGFALTLGMAGISYRSYRRKKHDNIIITAQKLEVERQKDVVETKNREMTESIAYARRLQEAVLPPPRVVREFFSDSFLLYMPRDIVSGDFYWMESRGGISYFAVGDCTGHGVPGAMLSVMGLNSLSHCITDLGLTSPKDMLMQVTLDLQTAFEGADETVQDGMDIALCALDIETGKLTYCGANNPLWIARQGEIIELAASKRPVGHSHIAQRPFEEHVFDLLPKDTIYLFSDGFADQQGGDNGKKLMRRSFRELLAALSTEPMHVQRDQLRQRFESWKSNFEQTDDVCVMGVRL